MTKRRNLNKISKTPKETITKSHYNLRDKKAPVDKNINESNKIGKNKTKKIEKAKSPIKKDQINSGNKDSTEQSNKTYVFNDFLILIDKKESNLVDIKKASLKKNQDMNLLKDKKIEKGKDNKINNNNKKDTFNAPLKNPENKNNSKILRKSSEIIYEPTLEDNINQIINKPNCLKPEIYSFLNNQIFELIMNNKKQNLIVIKLLNLREIKNLHDEFNLNFFERIKKNKSNEGIQNELNIKNNIILNDGKQEKIFIQNLKNILKQKESFPMIDNLFPNSSNNIFSYLEEPLYSMNEISFIRLMMTKYEEEIYHKENKVFCLPNLTNDYYINETLKDENDIDIKEIQLNKHVLKFRKYLLNLSYSKDLSNDNNIYHIIIPKNYLKNLDINNTVISLFDILELPISFYLYKQEPGELIIIEPECLHFSFCNNQQKTNKIIFSLMWNCLKLNSLQDYIILQKNLNKNQFKNFPIIKIFINLLSKKGKSLNVDILKTIYEIYNNFIKNENLEKYKNLIISDNFLTAHLNLNDVLICDKCGNEIFNYFSYEFNKLNQIIYICLNCFFKEYKCDNSFRLKNKILFYKYTKEKLITLEKKIVKLIDDKNKLNIYNVQSYEDKDEFAFSQEFFENDEVLLNLDSDDNINSSMKLDDMIYYLNAPCFLEEDQQKENTLNQELLNIFKDKGNMVNFSEINYKQKRQENIFDMKLKFNDIHYQNYKEPEKLKKELFEEKTENENKKVIEEKKKPKIKKANNVAELILLNQF